MLKANIISSFIFIQDHKENMEKKNPVIFRCISQPAFFSNPEKNHVSMLYQQENIGKALDRDVKTVCQDIHNSSLPSPSPLDTQLSHSQNTARGVGCAAVPGWGCSHQPPVLVFWLCESSMSGSAAEEQPQDCRGGTG